MSNLKRKIIAIAILAIPAALASAQSANFRAVLNREDSGYIGPVAQEQGIAPAASHATATTTLRVVLNPEDSGYIGPVAQEDTTAAPAGVAGSSFAQRMGQGGSKRSSSFLAPLGLHLGRRI